MMIAKMALRKYQTKMKEETRAVFMVSSGVSSLWTPSAAAWVMTADLLGACERAPWTVGETNVGTTGATVARCAFSSTRRA